MNNRAREFVNVLEALNKYMAMRDTKLKKCKDLSKIDCFLLQLLYNTKGKVIMNDLAEVLNVSHSRITRLMDNLCNIGLARREHSEEDRRRWYAVLTNEGEFRAKEICDKVINHQIMVLDMIPEEKLDQMLENLIIYSKAFENITKKLNKEGEVNDC